MIYEPILKFENYTYVLEKLKLKNFNSNAVKIIIEKYFLYRNSLYIQKITKPLGNIIELTVYNTEKAAGRTIYKE